MTIHELEDNLLLYRSRAIKWAIRYVKNEADAEDVVQRASLKAYRNRNQFLGESNWVTWFFTIVRSQALMWLREKKRVSCEIPMADDWDWGHDDTPEKWAILAEKFHLIEQRITKMSPILQNGMQMAIENSGGQCRKANGGKVRGRDKARIFRARKQLREMFEKAGLEEVISV